MPQTERVTNLVRHQLIEAIRSQVVPDAILNDHVDLCDSIEGFAVERMRTAGRPVAPDPKRSGTGKRAGNLGVRIIELNAVDGVELIQSVGGSGRPAVLIHDVRRSVVRPGSARCLNRTHAAIGIAWLTSPVSENHAAA